MTLQELNDAWNELRDGAIARDGNPRVAAPLASRVADQYSRWRAFYEDVGPQADFAPSVVASEWIDRYRELARAVAAARTDFAPSIPITEPTTIERIETIGRALGWGLAALGVALLGLSVAKVVSK